MPHTGPRLVWHRRQTRISGQALDGIARRKIKRRHERPRGRHPPDTLDTLQPLGSRRPRRILLPHRRNLSFHGGQLGGKGGQQVLEPFATVTITSGSCSSAWS